MVFVGSCNGFFRALDELTGRLIWQYDTRPDGSDQEFHGAPLLTPELVIAGSDARQEAGAGYVYAFERATGQLRWKRRVGRGAGADVLRHGASVYSVTLQDELICLDLGSGEVRWTFASGFSNDQFRLPWSPVLHGDRLVFGSLNGTVYAVHAGTGQAVWKRELGLLSTHPAVAAGHLYVGTRDRHLHWIDPETGAVQATIVLDQIPVMMPIVTGDAVVVLLGEEKSCCATIAALDPELKGIRWRRSGPSLWDTYRPLLWDDQVIVGTDKGDVYCYRIANGEIQWSRSFGGHTRGLGRSHDLIFIGDLTGRVIAFSPPEAR